MALTVEGKQTPGLVSPHIGNRYLTKAFDCTCCDQIYLKKFLELVGEKNMYYIPILIIKFYLFLWYPFTLSQHKALLATSKTGPRLK